MIDLLKNYIESIDIKSLSMEELEHYASIVIMLERLETERLMAGGKIYEL